jgi:hypothetical protein
MDRNERCVIAGAGKPVASLSLAGSVRWLARLSWLWFAPVALAQAPGACQPKHLPHDVKALKATLEAGCPAGKPAPGAADPKAWADVYEIDIRGEGVFAVRASSQAFDAYLELYSADRVRRWVNDDAENDAERGPSGLDASIRQRLNPGRYIILLTGKGGTGEYTLRASFEGSSSCPAPMIEVNQPRTVKFSESDCRVYHIQRGSGNMAFVQRFRFQLRRSGTLTCTPCVVFDDSNRRVPEGRSVPAGTYQIQVESSGPGQSKLNLRFQPRSCPELDAELNGKVAGVFSTADCRAGDVEGGSDSSLAKQYRVRVSRRGALTFGVEPKTVRATLRGGDPANLAPGEYVILLRSAAPVKFVLTTNFRISCPVEAIAPDTAVGGELTAQSCRESDPFPGSSDNYIQQYAVKIARSGTLRITAESPAFQPFVLWNGRRLPPDSTQNVEPGMVPFALGAPGGAVGPFKLRLAAGCHEFPLTPGQAVKGKLTNEGCRVREILKQGSDASYADQYRLVVSKPAAFQIDLRSAAFDAFLELYGSSYTQIATDDDGGGGKNARIVRELQPGTYFVLVKSYDKATGDYTLQASAAPAAPAAPAGCRIEEFGPPATLQGALSMADCRVREVLKSGDDESYVDQYRVRILQRGTLTVDLQPASFDGYISVWTTRYESRGSSSGSTGRNATLSVTLDPGEYIIFANSRSKSAVTGSYTIRASFPAQAPPGAGSGPLSSCTIGELALAAAASGTLSQADCRVTNLSAVKKHSPNVAAHRIRLAERGTLTVEMRSAAVDPYLVLLDQNFTRVAEDDDSAGLLNARIRTLLGPGVYYVIATSLPSNTRSNFGAYSLSTSFTPSGGGAPGPAAGFPCPVRELSLNSSMPGTLLESDCRTHGVALGSSHVPQVDAYRVRIPSPGVLTINLESVVFDAYLYLLDVSLRTIAQDDDGGGGGNARITRQVQPGEYIILANSLRRAGRPSLGSYTLLASFTASGAGAAGSSCAERPLALGASVTGTLTTTRGCRLRDILKSGTDDSEVVSYRLRVAEPGTLIIDLESGAFDAYLILLDGNLRSITQDDDGGVGTNARITHQVQPGEYVVLANSVKPATGEFQLRTSFQPQGAPSAACSAASVLNLNGQVSGSIAAGDCRVRDILTGSTDASLGDQYTLTLPARGTLTLDMISTTIDSVLILADARRRRLAEDDDGGEKLNARISQVLEAGDYIVVAKSLSATGQYTLRARFVAQDASPAPDVKPSCLATPIAINTKISRNLGSASCRVKDILGGTDSAFADLHRFTIDRRGEVTIQLSSTAFDAYAHLLGSTRNVLAQDDDSGGNGNARITRTLEPGVYTVLANSTGARSTGAYTLQVAFAASGAPRTPITSGPAGAIPEAFAGKWSERWGDVNEKGSIEILWKAGRPSVTVQGGWRVWNERIEGNALIFRKRGGGSDWEFEYTIRPLAKDRLSLIVFRIHDKRTFTGELYR